MLCFRRMNQTRIIAGTGIIIVLALLGLSQFILGSDTPSFVAVEPLLPAEEIATTTPPEVAADSLSSVTVSRPKTQSPILASREHIASWDFKGAYAGNPELMAKAQSEIVRLSDLLVSATSSKMIFLVGVANQYELLGDGEKQYDYLERAIRADATNSLPWHNLGVLMERLGALKTARAAYEKSTLLQPGMKFYQYAYIEFLITRMKGEKSEIERAFTFAEENIGETPYLLELRAQWQES